MHFIRKFETFRGTSNCNFMRNLLSLVLVLFFAFSSAVQAIGSDRNLQAAKDSTEKVKFITDFKPKQLIAPVALFGAGVIGNQIQSVKEFDFGLSSRDAIVHKNFYPEDVVQYLPAASFYILKLSGVKSAHNYGDATVCMALSYVITAITTYTIKEISGVQRPDGIGLNSFPSGHTATAFTGAEFLRLQYKDSNPWIGIAGYAVASGVALSRVAHNEHWFTDIIAGAGVGILSTRLAHWLYPWVQEKIVHKIFKPKKDVAFMGLPYYSGDGAGISLAMRF